MYKLLNFNRLFQTTDRTIEPIQMIRGNYTHAEKPFIAKGFSLLSY